MASLQILKSSLSLFYISHSNSNRKLCWILPELNSHPCSRKFLSFQSYRGSNIFNYRGFRVACNSKTQEHDDNQSNSEEPTESLFMKELKRRGITPASLLEESKRSSYADEEIKFKEEEGGYSRRNAVSTDYEKSLSNQRERSMALNSEGLEGLIPRAKLLLSLGGTFFLAFWPLVLITVAFSFALYLYFGSNFIHDGNSSPGTLPQYIDPYALLEDEMISRPTPRID
ncbi:Homeobox protein like [Actinidia chinensis var. chinensis]|uniref:Homeobox protein like n=1 Tax=Actinidia chinensis var. chinensis TaxID=1590841 RepID=A0A2R6RC80_ACTCC|nr:Homeobox protein like [Actinidia chinensis var. chinensis]